MTNPRIWVLLGPRTGDNNQALALAEALDMPFETKILVYNRLQALSVWLPGTTLTLTAESRHGLRPPWPDLVIAIGRRSVPVALLVLFLQRRIVSGLTAGAVKG